MYFCSCRMAANSDRHQIDDYRNHSACSRWPDIKLVQNIVCLQQLMISTILILVSSVTWILISKCLSVVASSKWKRQRSHLIKFFVFFQFSQQMLSQWLRLILRNPTIVNECYEKWSYTASTGFEDALRQLDRLSNLRFCLPTDLAVRQLQSIHDAFWTIFFSFVQ